MSHKQTLTEYLGDINGEQLLQNVLSTDRRFNSLDVIRGNMGELHQLFTVEADYEYEWAGDPARELPISKRFIQLRLEPLQPFPTESLLPRK